MDFYIIKYLAETVGSTEPAIRLLFSLILTYPMAWIYRSFLHDKSAKLQNSFFTFCGIGIGIFNFGFGVIHSIQAVIFTYSSLRVLGPSKNTVIVNFVFHMTYLLVGYYATETIDYDIKWTMPHCVLVLRLIGLCFDAWDGTKDSDSLSAGNKITALRHLPSFLETAAHVFFPASFLVGPQFSMNRLKGFVDGKLVNTSEPNCISAGLKRAMFGIGYMMLYQFGTNYLPDSYFLTEAFNRLSFFQKHIIIGIWGKIYLSKYVSCWLLTEGACITFGLAFNGIDENKLSKWDGCRNIRLSVFEGATKFGHYIDSFNLNTNAWVAQYVYKRMAFLGNRNISQGITLLFLAIWHGLHSGYYMTFYMEFAIMFMEKQIESILNKNETVSKVSQKTLFKMILFVFLKLYAVVFMGYCLIPFALLTFHKWWQVYTSLYFSGFIVFFPWPILYKPIMCAILKPSKSISESR